MSTGLYHPADGREITIVEKKIEWGAWSVLVGEEFYATADSYDEALFYAYRLAAGHTDY